MTEGIQSFIDKKRAEIKSGELSKEELERLALNLLNLYEGEVVGQGSNSIDAASFEEDDEGFDSNIDEEF
ncbi:MAG: hypothetical protein NTW50_01270 [Candidatus Berkelbacteria bacterium]|nr:hypothetical protein [Candidatus Berkelbacteria bacterium]